jgi:CBS domain-containing protein
VSATPENTWRKALLPADATVQQAIRNLDESSLQIALVVSPDGALLGTITDGDIRRGLLWGLDLNSPIDTIMNCDAFVVPPQMGREMVFHLMQANKILQLPVVDADRRVIGLHLWDELTALTHVLFRSSISTA